MTSDIIEQADRVIAATYGRFPIVFEKGSGTRLWDIDGREYVDFVAGIAVCSLGHAHPEIARALADQAQTLLHVSNLYYTIPQTDLATWLTKRSFADRVFFCNSGAEANEAAIKLARRYFVEKGETGRFHIVAMEKSFHGRTFAALSATGQEKIRKGFEPVLPGFSFVPFNDLEALEKSITPSTCAVILEPLQGEGGVVCPDPGYLAAVRKLCDRAGALMILDEIQTGIGRTGALFAHQHFDTAPDIMTLAKALGNGLPIGAMLAKEEVAAAFVPGSHASTFGGTPIITAGALRAMNILDEDDVVSHASKMGNYFKKQLEALKERCPVVEEVRGMGLLLGLRLKKPGAPVVKACMEKGFLINCIQDDVLRFVPPLIIQPEEIDSLVACLAEVFADME